MKLHLPITLFTALMAVMTTLPSYAKYELRIGDNEISDWNGNLAFDEEAIKPYLGGKGESEFMSFIGDEVNLTLTKEGADDAQDTVHFYGSKQSPSSAFTFQGDALHNFTIGEGCNFIIEGTSAYFAAGYGGRSGKAKVDISGKLTNTCQAKLLSAESGQTAEADIVIHKGGVLDSGGVDLMKEDADFSRDRKVGMILSEVKSGGSVDLDITVEKGGLLFARDLEVGKVNLGSDDVETYSRTNFVLNGGEFNGYHNDQYQDQNESKRIGECHSGKGVSYTTIDVQDGGSFTIDGGKYVIIGSTTKGTSVLRINVSGKNEDNKASFFSVHADISDSYDNSFLAEISCSNTSTVAQNTVIRVENGGVFEFNGGLGADSYMYKRVQQRLLNLESTPDSTGNLIGGDLVTDITIDNATFRLRDKNACIGILDEIIEHCTSDTKPYSVSTTIQMHGDSLLDMSVDLTGAMYYSYKDENGKWQKKSGAGIWGDILIGGGRLDLADTDIGGDHAIHGQVIILTDLEYSGVVDLDGLSAAKIGTEFNYTVSSYNEETKKLSYEKKSLKGFRIGKAGTRIVGLQAGTTLTLKGNKEGGYDNSITVGTSSAYLKTGSTGDPEGYGALIEFNGDGGIVKLESGTEITLNFDGKLVDGILSGAEDGKVQIEVWFTNGSLTLGDGNGVPSDFFKIGDGWGLYAAYIVDPEEEQPTGKLLITGDISKVWASKEKLDPNESGVYSGELNDEVSKATKVVIDGDTELKSTTGGTLEQLEGECNLHITGEGEVNLDNATVTAFPTGTPDSTFKGMLTTDENVNLHKTGEGTLTLGGGLKAGGDVTVKEGELIIGGEDSSIGGALTVDDTGSKTKGTLNVQGNLTANDVNVQSGTLTFEADSEGSIGGQLTLGEKGTLAVDGQLTLSGSVNEGSTGTLTGNGTVILDGENVRFGEDMTLGEELTIQMGEHCKEADFGDNEVKLDDLTGSGSITGEKLTVSNGEEEVFSGTLNGNATVEEGHSFHVQGLQGSCNFTMEGGSALDLTQGGNSLGGVKSTPSQEGVEDSGATYKLQTGTDSNTVNGDFVIRKEDTTIINLDLSQDAMWGTGECDSTMLTTTGVGRIIIEEGTTFEIYNLKDIVAEHSGSGLKDIVIMTGNIDTSKDYTGSDESLHEAEGSLKAKVKLDGILKALFKSAHIRFEDAVATAVAADVPAMVSYSIDMLSTRAVDPVNKKGILVFDPYTNSDIRESSRSSVAYAGGLLLNHYVSRNLFNSDPAVLEIMEAIGNATDAGNAGEVNRIRAAVAGSTLTSVSAAQSAALRNQMGRVRDHALQAARLRCAGDADEATAQQRPCKNSHVWVEGTSFFSEQHSVGDESGYRLNSWGGAVGIDAQVDAYWSVGLSLSAGYGDLEAHAADDAKGDLDTYTVSFWSQAKKGRWGNTLLFTLGTNEADLKRTVNYGAGSYTATSNASGSSLGAMWELTYDLHPVKDNKSNILQPLFNVAVMHTSMDGFSEKNAGNVGLAAEKQTRDTMTLGLGLRWLAAINSAKAVNRTVSTEVHANVAQDMGDRRSVANVALLADPNFTQRVYGSKTGSTAFQFGAGVNVPVTPNSQIYVNAGGELREHANAWNAALGVRMGF